MGEVSEGTGRFPEEQTLVLVLYQPAVIHARPSVQNVSTPYRVASTGRLLFSVLEDH